jgi:hypothetical protein
VSAVMHPVMRWRPRTVYTVVGDGPGSRILRFPILFLCAKTLRLLLLLPSLPHQLSTTLVAQDDLDEGRLGLSLLFIGERQLEGGETGGDVTMAAGVGAGGLADAGDDLGLCAPSESKLEGDVSIMDRLCAELSTFPDL